MKFQIESADIWGFDHEKIIKKYGNIFDEFGISENADNGNAEIQIETLEDFLNLARRVDNPLIVDPDYVPPKITIYDDYIE